MDLCPEVMDLGITPVAFAWFGETEGSVMERIYRCGVTGA